MQSGLVNKMVFIRKKDFLQIETRRHCTSRLQKVKSPSWEKLSIFSPRKKTYPIFRQIINKFITRTYFYLTITHFHPVFVKPVKEILRRNASNSCFLLIKNKKISFKFHL